MNKRVLSEAEIQYILTLPEPNDRKGYAQKLIIDHLSRVRHLLLTAHTRFGKLYLLKALFLRYRKVSDKPINIVVPTSTIKEEFERFLTGIPGVRIFLLPTYSSGRLPADQYECGMLVGDEAHYFLNSKAEKRSKVLSLTTGCDIRLVMTATVTEEMRSFLRLHGIREEFSIPLKTGLRIGIVPQYQNLNLGVELTPGERQTYDEYCEKLDNYLRPFEIVSPVKAQGLAMLCANPSKPESREAINRVAKQLGFSYNAILGSAINYRSTVGARASLLYSAEEKKWTTLELLNILPKQKIILFGSLLKTGDWLAKRNPQLQVYRGGTTSRAKHIAKSMLDAFNSNQKLYLYGCNILDEGLTVNDCSLAINLGVKSVDRKDIQRMGRLIGLDENNPDKVATKINLYAKDTQERVWLDNSQRGGIGIYELDSISDLAEYLPINSTYEISE